VTESNEVSTPEVDPGKPSAEARRSAGSSLVKAATWLATFGCFYLVYVKVEAAGAREGLSAFEYLANFFAEADWIKWLSVMIPYSIFFFLVDSHATWRLIRWFNAPDLRYRDVLPIRASAYILSLVNEQVGKGAMALYLLRRHRVTGWEVASSMIFLGVVEIYQLFVFSAAGVAARFDLVREASSQLPLYVILPTVFLVAAVYLPIHMLYFAGKLLPGWKLRERPIMHAFRSASPLQYLLLLLFKAPNLIMAVVVYTIALDLFQVQIAMVQMFAFLPVIFLAAALPLPFHAGALLLWTVLFPDYPEVGAFSLVMHSFFVTFNAIIGVAFLPKANRELFEKGPESRPA
jgi:hypothetical protein